MTVTAAKIAALADLLDQDDVFDAFVSALYDARNAGPRLRDQHGDAADRDGGEILEDVIRALRAKANPELVPA